MAFEELKDNIAEADRTARSYIDTSAEYYKLKAFKFLMQAVMSFSKMLIVGVIAFIALLFLSLAASYGIGQALDNTFQGFLVVGGFYLLVGILFYLVRDRINKPLLKKFSEFYFDD
ncbi:phage holin family protein [Zeaxanthinibacter enoshimensis]|uniref:Putative superfamily III holin-X n=1 Tax=Zeaxanthinibacter enoshimensis TaxID=392009 RepID=A0A4R6TMR5_9FLAO|nr:phage holin family protein [Zeaxanthinibacter enoshimensis]TDQ32812.1 putative superfamily III holin-X [Zeaxanthinibacter enoshimensis]